MAGGHARADDVLRPWLGRPCSDAARSYAPPVPELGQAPAPPPHTGDRGREKHPWVCGWIHAVQQRYSKHSSPVREMCTLDSMSGKRKRSRSGVEGIGGMAMDAGVHAPLTSGLEHPASTLLRRHPCVLAHAVDHFQHSP